MGRVMMTGITAALLSLCVPCSRVCVVDAAEEDYGGPPYHLFKADPEIYQIKLYKAVLVGTGGAQVILYDDTAGMSINLVNGQFQGVADVNIPADTYSQIQITTSTTFGLKGYCLYNGTYYYTKSTSNQSDIGSSATIPTGLSDYGTQTATITDPGSGTEVGPTIGGDPTFIYSSSTSVAVDPDQRPAIQVEFLANQALELNDSTTNTINNGSPAQITFSAPEMDVTVP